MASLGGPCFRSISLLSTPHRLLLQPQLNLNICRDSSFCLKKGCYVQLAHH